MYLGFTLVKDTFVCRPLLLELTGLATLSAVCCLPAVGSFRTWLSFEICCCRALSVSLMPVTSMRFYFISCISCLFVSFSLVTTLDSSNSSNSSILSGSDPLEELRASNVFFRSRADPWCAVLLCPMVDRLWLCRRVCARANPDELCVSARPNPAAGGRVMLLPRTVMLFSRDLIWLCKLLSMSRIRLAS